MLRLLIKNSCRAANAGFVLVYHSPLPLDIAAVITFKEDNMNRIKYSIVVGIAIFMMGCPTRSLFPLFTESDLVFNPALVGTWIDVEGADTFTFQKAGEKSYNVVSLEQKGNSEGYRVQLGRLGKFWFIDSYPLKGGGDHHTLSAHILSRIWLNGDTLRMASLESDWLRGMIDAKTLSIAHVRRDGDIILTATTEELQQLVLRFAEDDKAFPDPGVFIRTK